jgi:hypothetical protein
VKKPRVPESSDQRAGRKNSDTSTVVEGEGGRRKQSLETNSMAFDGNEEIKESMMMESFDERYSTKERSNSRVAQKPGDRAGSATRGAVVNDDQFNGVGGIMIDLATLKKLLNRVTCEFILSLI